MVCRVRTRMTIIALCDSVLCGRGTAGELAIVQNERIFYRGWITLTGRDVVLPRPHPNGEKVLIINVLCGRGVPRPYQLALSIVGITALAGGIMRMALISLSEAGWWGICCTSNNSASLHKFDAKHKATSPTLLY